MRKAKRIFALVLSFALLLSSMYIPAFADDNSAAFTLTLNRLTGSAETGLNVGDAIGTNDELVPNEYVLLTLGMDAEKVSEYQVTVNFDSDILAYSSDLERDSHYSDGYSVRDTLTEEWSSKTSNLQDDGKSIITTGAYDKNSTVKSYKTTALIYFVFQVKAGAETATGAKLFWLSQDDETKAKIGYRDEAKNTVQYTPDISAEIFGDVNGVLPTLAGGKLTLSDKNTIRVGGKLSKKQPTLNITALTSAGGTNLLANEEIEWGVYQDEQGNIPAIDRSLDGKGQLTGWYEEHDMTGWRVDTKTGVFNIDPLADFDPEAESKDYYLIAKAKSNATTVTANSSVSAKFRVTHETPELYEVKLERPDPNDSTKTIVLDGSNKTITVDGKKDIVITATGIDQFGHEFQNCTLSEVVTTTANETITVNTGAKTFTIGAKSHANAENGQGLVVRLVDSNGKTVGKGGIIVARSASVAATMTLTGDTTVTINPAENTTKTYTAALKDQFDDDFSSTAADFTWSLTEVDAANTGKITISDAGVLTVATDAVADEIKVSAVKKTNSALTASVDVSVISLSFDTAITVTTKEKPVYGDKWNDIVTSVQVGSGEAADITSDGMAYTAKLGDQEIAGKITLKDAETKPGAGSQTAAFVFSATGNTNYQNIPVPATMVKDAEVMIDKASFTPTVSLEGWTYGETAKTPSVSNNTSNGTVTYGYKVKDAQGEFASTVPTNAGQYTVQATIAATDNYNAATATADFTIGAKALTLTWPESKSYPYGDDLSALTATVSGAVSGDTVTPTYQYEGRADTPYNSSTTKPTAVGTYTITAAVANTNYTIATGASAEFEIVKAANTLNWTKQSYTYQYGATADLPAATVTNGTPAVKYYSDEACKTELQSTDALDAGTYYAKATAAETDTHVAPDAITTSFTVTKATYAGTGTKTADLVVPTVASTNRTYTVSADVFTWLTEANGFKDWSVKSAAIGTNAKNLLSKVSGTQQTVTYSTNKGAVDDTATITVVLQSKNYEDITLTLNLTAKSIVPKMDGQINLTFQNVTAVPGKVYGAKNSDLVSISEAAATAEDAEGKSVSGTISVKASEAIQSVDTNNAVTVVFTAGDGEYKGETIEYNVPVTIAKKTVDLTWSTAELTFNGQAQSKTATVGGYVGKETGLEIDTYSYIDKAATDPAESATKPTNAGNYTVIAKTLKAAAGATAVVGNYQLPTAASVDFTIAPKALTANDIAVTDPATTYTGKALDKIAIAVRDGNTTLVKDTDYTLAYSVAQGQTGELSNDLPLKAGTYTVTVTGKGNYTGTKTATLTVNPLRLANNNAVSITVGELTYSGDALAPDVTVKVNGVQTNEFTATFTASTAAGSNAKTEKVNGKDMPKNAGAYTVSVELTGNIASPVDADRKAIPATATFKVAPKTVNSIEASISRMPYTGKKIEPVFTLTSADGIVGKVEALVKNVDYVVVYSNNIAVGTATATVTFRGNYTNGTGDSFKPTFQITPAEVTGAEIALSEDTFTYTGAAQTPTVTVSEGDDAVTTYRAGTDYETKIVAGTANITDAAAYGAAETVSPVAAGTYKVAVKFTGNYSGVATATYTIAPKALPEQALSLTPDTFVYDGTAKRPTVTVKDGSKTLVKDTDYTLKYQADGKETSDTKNVGTYTVIATGAGNYSGTSESTFDITAGVRTFTADVTSVTLKKDDTNTKQITVTDSASGDAAVTYTSSNESVATVNETGLITAVSAGTATITVSSEATANYPAATPVTIAVTVTANELQPVEFTEKPETSVVVYGASGNSYQLAAKATRGEEEVTEDIRFTSSNPAVAAVESGALVIKGIGTTTVTATAARTVVGETTYEQGSDSFTLTVTPKTVTVSGWKNTALTYTGKKQGPTVDVEFIEGDRVALNIVGNEETNAGSYTATITGLTGADADKYTLAGEVTKAWTIAKAARELSAEESVKLTPKALVKSLGITASDKDGSFANAVSYAVSGANTDAISVNLAANGGKGSVTAMKNGSATITINVAATDNYNEESATVQVSAVTQLITAIDSVTIDSNPAENLKAEITDNGILVTGVIPADKEAVVTYQQAKEDGTSEQNTFTVSKNDGFVVPDITVALDEEEYQVSVATDVEELVIEAAIVMGDPSVDTDSMNFGDLTLTQDQEDALKEEAGAAASSVTSTDAAASAASTAAATAADEIGTFVDDVKKDSVIAGFVDEGSTDTIEKQLAAAGVTLESTVEISFDVKVEDYVPTGSGPQTLTVEIQPMYSVKVEAKQSDAVLTSRTSEAKPLDLSDGKYDKPTEVRMVIPAAINPDGLFVVHTFKDKNNKDASEELKVTKYGPKDGGLEVGFTPTHFSTFALTSSTTSVDVKFVSNGAEFGQDTYNGSKIGEQFPAAQKVGATFLGWSETEDAIAADYSGKLSMDKLKPMAASQNIAADGTLTLYAVFDKADVNLTVTDNETGEPIANAQVTGGITGTTDANGKLFTSLDTDRDYSFTVKADDYKTYNGSVKTDSMEKTVEVKLVAGSDPVNPSPDGGSVAAATGKVTTASGVSGGSLKYSATSAKAGETVIITPTAEQGYKLSSVTVKDSSGNAVAVIANADGTYSFQMPEGDVVVTPVFEKFAMFTDVVAGSFYEKAVDWAVAQGITNGKGSTTTFKPNDTCTRAEAVTFLYRAAGEPAVTASSQFTDVAANSYYAKAVAWAVANGITNGKGSTTTFKPDDTCSRAEIVTFIARFEKAAAGNASSFSDVSANAYYAGSVGWAVAQGITNGKGSTTTFKPDDTCTRAEIVTFLYRDFVK
ncbi:MAG: S-layer homology domain-containing protein [Oscillospiraceae bacterium]|nr:S-layer homology domain-containing protein [Oscillospiraceae bacterium]